MVRTASWICLVLVLVSVVACAGPRAGCEATCQPACACSDEPGPQPCDRPPEAKPGEAWCPVWIPPVYETQTTRVCVCPESCRTIRIAAEYGTLPELVCVAPAKMTEVITPAVYETKKEDVCVRGPREVFRRVECESGVAGDCERQGECWVKQDCPPVFETRERHVCVAPPRKTIKWTPAKYELREKRFVVKPERCGKEVVAAQYEDRTCTVCVSCGRWEWRRNDNCIVPVEGLPALEVEMVDSDPDGNPEGVFSMGSIVRYDLTVRSDVGSEAFPTIKVVFALPEHLQFISGQGMGVAITGEGQNAKSSSFKLSIDQEVKMHILARVLSVPTTAYVQTTASIQTDAGEELATETESTTLSNSIAK
ncbi:MAG: hypothetical protein O2894_00025 [Planctomycetota bacterium]|nr:hypothetical protein [Planctomycetota bacterium]